MRRLSLSEKKAIQSQYLLAIVIAGLVLAVVLIFIYKEDLISWVRETLPDYGIGNKDVDDTGPEDQASNMVKIGTGSILNMSKKPEDWTCAPFPKPAETSEQEWQNTITLLGEQIYCIDSQSNYIFIKESTGKVNDIYSYVSNKKIFVDYIYVNNEKGFVIKQ